MHMVLMIEWAWGQTLHACLGTCKLAASLQSVLVMPHVVAFCLVNGQCRCCGNNAPTHDEHEHDRFSRHPAIAVLSFVSTTDEACYSAGLYITYPHDKRNAKKVGLSETLLEGALLNK